MTDKPTVFAGIEPPEKRRNGERRAFKHASASQIETFRRCPRKWFFAKILGYPSPSTPALELGVAVHEELERYLLASTTPGPIASAGLDLLPKPPVDPELVEAFFALVDPSLPVPIVGKIDLLEPPESKE